jgi:hypothetical protein
VVGPYGDANRSVGAVLAEVLRATPADVVMVWQNDDLVAERRKGVLRIAPGWVGDIRVPVPESAAGQRLMVEGSWIEQ